MVPWRPLPPFQSASVELIRAPDAEEARETGGNRKSAGGERRRVISFSFSLPLSHPFIPPSPRPLHSRRLLSIAPIDLASV